MAVTVIQRDENTFKICDLILFFLYLSSVSRYAPDLQLSSFNFPKVQERFPWKLLVPHMFCQNIFSQFVRSLHWLSGDSGIAL